MQKSAMRISASMPEELAAKLQAIEPQLMRDMSEWTGRQRERRHVSRALSSLNEPNIFPLKLEVNRERPDFIAHVTRTEKKIGIEVTELRNENEAQFQYLLNNRLLPYSHYSPSHPLFSPDAKPLKKSKGVIKAIRVEFEVPCEEIVKYNALIRRIGENSSELMDENVVHLRQSPGWSNDEAERHEVKALEFSIHKKTATMKRYKICDEHWLVVEDRWPSSVTRRPETPVRAWCLEQLIIYLKEFASRYWAKPSTFSRIVFLRNPDVFDMSREGCVRREMIDSWIFEK
jgi:mannose-6-phosphate isomerase-like protein (cupin superfamily)